MQWLTVLQRCCHWAYAFWTSRNRSAGDSRARYYADYPREDTASVLETSSTSRIPVDSLVKSNQKCFMPFS